MHFTIRTPHDTRLREKYHIVARPRTAQFVTCGSHASFSAVAAFPDFLPAIKATRPCWPCCFVGNTMNVRYGVCRRLPHENRSEISPRDLMVSNLKLSLHAETLAALGATSSQHLAAALRRHTSTETVALSPLTSVRLIRALHIDSLSWF